MQLSLEPCLNKEMTMNTSDTPVTGRIFNVQHFCVDDGEGIRTTVFLKGCPLRCEWCHNPESYKSEREIMLRDERCRLCAGCASVCAHGAHTFLPDNKHVYDREKCTVCGDCINVCRFEAIESVGKSATVDEILAEVLADRVFYEKSGGGVTVSGGEPTAQPKFTEALLSACKREGIGTCIETSGWCKSEIITNLIPSVDLFLFDWKITDDDLHQKYTGVSNKPIVENLAILNDAGARVILRCPLIPDVNLTEHHFDGIASLANRFDCIESIELEPYHPLGISKSRALGRESAYANSEFFDRDTASRVREYIANRVSISVSVLGK